MLRRSMTLALAGLLLSGAALPRRANAPANLQLAVATIHAAALTTPRAAGDTLDHPYLLVSRLGPNGAANVGRLPATSHFVIRNNEALGAQTLLSLGLEPGDSAQLLVSLLENPDVHLTEEAQVAQAGAAVLRETGARRASVLAEQIAPLVKQGAQWIGSARVVIANDGGTLRWKQLECVATCTVVAAPTAPDILPAPAPQSGGVLELSGAKGTYHVNLRTQRMP